MLQDKSNVAEIRKYDKKPWDVEQQLAVFRQDLIPQKLWIHQQERNIYSIIFVHRSITEQTGNFKKHI